MKLRKGIVVSLAAAMLCQSVAGIYPEQVITQAAAGVFPVSEIPELAAGSRVEMSVNTYKSVSYMYTSNETRIVDVSFDGTLTAKDEGTAVINVSIMYNFTTVDTASITVKVEKDGEQLVIKDEKGDSIEKITFPDPVIKAESDNTSVAEVEVAGDQMTIKAVNAGSATVRFWGEIGDTVYGEGVIPV